MANNPEFFGQIAIRKNFVSLEQLDKCLRLQKRMHPPLRIGEILLEQKCLSQGQLDDVLAAQLRQPGKDELILIDDETLEKTVLVKGIASKKHLKEARRIQTTLKQQGQKKNLAEIMLERKFISITQLRRINNAPKKNDEDDEYPKIEGYDIIKKIRKGGMGTVYKARQMSMDRIIALKVLAPELADDKTYVERFFIEAKAVAKLNDENIVKGYDVGQSNGYYFFVMELINGETILEIMKREKILSVPFALQVTYQTTKALAHAAKHKIIHRDIKPGNIMINLNNEIKLCDLGFAKTSNIDLLTKKGTTLGTPYYMSPEQCRGLQDIDTRSDIYSLGATLYHMLIGKVPFTGSTASEILKKHLVQDLVIPQQRRASLGEHICHLIEKMMAKKREDRYATPQDVIDELEPLMARFEAKKMIVLHPSGWPGAHDLALFLAEGAFVEGNKVDLVSADDVTSEQLTTAGAIVIGSIATPNGDLPPEIRGVLDIMKRFPNDMRGKIGSAFISHEGDGDMATRSSQLYKILQALLSMGLIVEGGFDNIFSGESVIDDYDSAGAEKYRSLGRGLAMTLLNITAGKKTMQKSWGTIQPSNFSIHFKFFEETLLRKTFFFLVVFAITVGCSQNTANFELIQENWSKNSSWKSTEKKCLLQDAEFREKDAYWLKKKYKKNIYLQPHNAESYFLYGRLLGLLKKPNVAINYFHQALNYDSEYLWALYSIGILHLKEDAHLQAQIFLQRCIDLDFQFTPGLVALAKLKIKNNKQQALYLLFCAETFSPKNVEIKQHIANVFALLEQYDKALIKYREIDKVSPSNIVVLNEWGKLLVKLKKYKAALLVMNKLYKLLPENKKFAMEKTISLVTHLMKKNRGIE